MHIIFGDSINHIPDSFTVLELDTFYVRERNENVKTYCVLEKIPLVEFATLEEFEQAHSELIKQYNLRNWTFCKNSIEALMGHWAGELDTFYQELEQRINNLIENPPGEEWTGVIEPNAH
jgi:hypothetical protein